MYFKFTKAERLKIEDAISVLSNVRMREVVETCNILREIEKGNYVRMSDRINATDDLNNAFESLFKLFDNKELFKEKTAAAKEKAISGKSGPKREKRYLGKKTK